VVVVESEQGDDPAVVLDRDGAAAAGVRWGGDDEERSTVLGRSLDGCGAVREVDGDLVLSGAVVPVAGEPVGCSGGSAGGVDDEIRRTVDVVGIVLG